MSVPKTLNVEGQELVLLPTTPEELDTFVAEITSMYGLPEGEGTYESIATAILHMPPNKAYAPIVLFGHSGLKTMANTAAFGRLQEINARRNAAQRAKDLAAKEQTEKEKQEATATDDVQSVSGA